MKSVLLFLCTFFLMACGNIVKEQSSKRFTTWDNICFDRASSIWLIKHFVDSTSSFEIIPFGQKITKGTPFDVPGSELGRHRNISCFESILIKYKLNDPALVDISKIVHDIDVNTWGPKLTPEADSLDRLFKKIYKSLSDKKKIIDSTSLIASRLYSLKSTSK